MIHLLFPVLVAFSRVDTVKRIEMLLDGQVRNFSEKSPLSKREIVAVVTVKNRPALGGVQYGLYPAIGSRALLPVTGAEADSTAKFLFGRSIPGLAQRPAVASRNDWSMIDPYHVNFTSVQSAEAVVHVEFRIHHVAEGANRGGNDIPSGVGTATLHLSGAGRWYVSAFSVPKRFR